MSLSADAISHRHSRVSFTILRRESCNKCAPWLFLKTSPPLLARLQTSKVNIYREKHWHSYLLHFTQNSNLFVKYFLHVCQNENLKNTHHVCFHHRSLEYKRHLNKPHVSICLCKLQLDDLDCNALQGYKTNIERTVFRLVCKTVLNHYG